jgi:hypothetical protein
LDTTLRRPLASPGEFREKLDHEVKTAVHGDRDQVLLDGLGVVPLCSLLDDLGEHDACSEKSYELRSAVSLLVAGDVSAFAHGTRDGRRTPFSY